MATIPSINVPNPDAADALEALERVWLPDTERRMGKAAYEALTGPQKARALLITEIRVRVRNLRRERAERAVTASEPDVN